MAGVDCFLSGIGGCASISETNCPKNGMRKGLWIDIRFRTFSGVEDWRALNSSDCNSAIQRDMAVSTKRRKNRDCCRLRMSDTRTMRGTRKSSRCSGEVRRREPKIQKPAIFRRKCVCHKHSGSRGVTASSNETQKVSCFAERKEGE